MDYRCRDGHLDSRSNRWFHGRRESDRIDIIDKRASTLLPREASVWEPRSGFRTTMMIAPRRRERAAVSGSISRCVGHELSDRGRYLSWQRFADKRVVRRFRRSNSLRGPLPVVSVPSRHEDRTRSFGSTGRWPAQRRRDSRRKLSSRPLKKSGVMSERPAR